MRAPFRTFCAFLMSTVLASADGVAFAQQPLPTATDGLCTTTVSLPPPQGGGRAGGAGARGFGAGQPAPTQLPRLVKVRDDVYVIQNANDVVAEIGAFGGNITVYITDEGVILIDSKNAQMHDDVVAKVKSLTDKPITYVVLTHHHPDHSGGAARMQQIGASVIISRDDRRPMGRGGAAGLPQVAYFRNATLALGGKEVQLTEFCGHTSGDTVAYLPAARVVSAGDLVTTPDAIPQIVNYGDGGNWTDLGKTLDAIAAMDFDFLVGGHGPILTRQQFLDHRAKVVRIRERARTLVKDGKTQEEIAQALRKELNWGDGPAAGNIPGMMAEFR